MNYKVDFKINDYKTLFETLSVKESVKTKVGDRDVTFYLYDGHFVMEEHTTGVDDVIYFTFFNLKGEVSEYKTLGKTISCSKNYDGEVHNLLFIESLRTSVKRASIKNKLNIISGMLDKEQTAEHIETSDTQKINHYLDKVYQMIEIISLKSQLCDLAMKANKQSKILELLKDQMIYHEEDIKKIESIKKLHMM